MAELIKELVIEAAKEFKVHLEEPNNKRIIFSGRFGKGKTTFLEEFFSNQNEYLGSKKFRYIYLDPVHYSVASNEDIFKYIKYDILLSLISLDVDFEDIQFSTFETASYYIWRHPEEAIKPLIEFIPKVGKVINAVLPKLEDLYKKIKTFENVVNSKPETAQIVKFFEEVHVDPKSIYESDTITFIIQNLLKKEKVQESVCNEDAMNPLQNVLIIDNLDRIDPEHIFRILNVFSAHMDFHRPSGNENKLGFDKILLVCDLDNIRNIFRNKYGRDVDFNGYINKFYSNDIFYFQNYEQISDVCTKLILNTSINYQGVNEKETFGSLIRNYDFGIFKIVPALILKNIITLRQVFNATSSSFYINSTSIKFNGDYTELFENSPLLEIKFLTKILGGYHHLKEAITTLYALKFPIRDYDYYFKKLLYFDTKKLHTSQAESLGFISSIGNDYTKYLVKVNFHERRIDSIAEYIEVNKEIKEPYTPTLENFYAIYLKVIEDAYKYNVIA